MNLDERAQALRAADTAFCTATVVKTEGSAPGRAGAKMIVTAEESFGTVGGGRLEHAAIADARGAIRRREPRLVRYDLTEEGLQPCGGAVEIFLEPVLPQRSVVVFGAGHIAEKLCPLLSELGFEVTLVDERAERISLKVFENVPNRINRLPAEALASIEFDDDLHIVCITHAHAHDEEIVRFCLGKPYRYLGLISSRSKWRLFSEKYRKEGFTGEQLARVFAPIGLDIGAESPFEIAVSIAAQLIQLEMKPKDFRKGRCHFRLSADEEAT